MSGRANGGFARAAKLSAARRAEIARAGGLAPKMTEGKLHRAVAAFLAVALPTDNCTWTTFPAGGGGRVRGAMLKAAGLRKGWPDVQILWNGGSRPAFVGIELKTRTGRLDPEQIECHAAIRAGGGYVFICRSLDEVEGFLIGFGIPMRATTFGLGSRRLAA